MPMVIIGVLLILAKAAEFGPFANWSWWIILAPFAVAAVWWQFADSSGLTMKRQMDKMEKRKVDRREQSMEALGIDPRLRRRVAQDRKRADVTPARDGPPTSAKTTADPTKRD